MGGNDLWARNVFPPRFWKMRPCSGQSTFLAGQLGEAWHKERKKIGQRRLRMGRKIFDAEEGKKRIQANPILGVDRYSRDWSLAVLRQNRSQAHLTLVSGTVLARKIERSIALLHHRLPAIHPLS